MKYRNEVQIICRCAIILGGIGFFLSLGIAVAAMTI